MFLSLAWRNIWRSKGSTRITMMLTIWATLALATFMYLLNGTFDKQYDDTINLYPGYIHIKHPLYADDPIYDNLMFDIKSIKEKLKGHEDIDFITTRIETFFLFAAKENSFGAMLVGVNPSSEEKMTRIDKQLIEGRYLNDDDTNGVIVGKTMAKKLGISLGGEFSIVGSAIDNSFTADNLKVVGIFATGVEGYDAQFAMVNKAYFDGVINSENIASHIIVKPKDVDDSMDVAKALETLVGSEEVCVIDWHVHMKTVIDALLLIKVSRYMLIVFVLFVIFSVISIFALMTLFSRTYEIGLMHALGTTPRQIILIILLERFMLSAISITIGSLLAAGLAMFIHAHPITFAFATNYANSIGFLDLVLITKFSYENMFTSAGYILLFSMLTLFYPLWKISQLKPIDAMKT